MVTYQRPRLSTVCVSLFYVIREISQEEYDAERERLLQMLELHARVSGGLEFAEENKIKVGDC